MRILHVTGERLRDYISKNCTAIAAARLNDVLDSFGHSNDAGNANEFAQLDANQFASVLAKVRGGIRVGQSSVRAFLTVKKWMIDTELFEARAEKASGGTFCGLPQGVFTGAASVEDVEMAARIAKIAPVGDTTAAEAPVEAPSEPPAAGPTVAVTVRLTPDQLRAIAQLLEAFGRPVATMAELARIADAALAVSEPVEPTEDPSAELGGFLTDFPPDAPA